MAENPSNNTESLTAPATAPAVAVTSQPASQPANQPNQPTIILAEDDLVLQDMYSERLKAEGFQVIVAQNGEEALAKVAEITPALMILDIMMPKMNGIDVLKELKSKDATKNIPVIVATALVQDMSELKKMLSPKDAYLIKSEVMPGDVIKLVKDKLSGSTAQTIKAETT